MSGIPPSIRTALKRIADSPQRVVASLRGSLAPAISRLSVAPPAPAHVENRLEDVFDALADLSLQPNIATALELASDVLESELPTATLAAALHDIDTDEMRFVVARGSGHETLKGTAMPLADCLVGPSAYELVLTDGGPQGAAWIAPEGAQSPVLLCPILHDRHLLGLLALADPICSAQFGDHDVELVRYVSGQLGSVIHELRQRPPAAEHLRRA
jgi:GAF domain-containing protein